MILELPQVSGSTFLIHHHKISLISHLVRISHLPIPHISLISAIDKIPAFLEEYPFLSNHPSFQTICNQHKGSFSAWHAKQFVTLSSTWAPAGSWLQYKFAKDISVSAKICWFERMSERIWRLNLKEVGY